MNGLFFHIPKTAGSSQISIINQYKHLKCYNTEGYFESNTKIEWKEYFSWTMVRNPYDKLASILGAWKWKTIHKSMNDILNLVELGYKLEWKLSDIVQSIDPDIQASDLWQQTDMAILTHLVPMNVYVEKWKKQTNKSLDFIGRFENLQEDWKFIKQKICIDDDLPILNKSEHKPYQKYFVKQKIRDRAIELYKEDFNLFNYSKELK